MPPTRDGRHDTIPAPVTAPLWQPSPEQVERSNLTAFMRSVEADWGASVPDYPSLHRWSLEEPERFWCSLWDFADVRAQRRGERVLEDAGRIFREGRPDDPHPDAGQALRIEVVGCDVEVMFLEHTDSSDEEGVSSDCVEDQE